jgi:hypothetical protein
MAVTVLTFQVVSNLRAWLLRENATVVEADFEELFDIFVQKMVDNEVVWPLILI